MLQIYEYFAKLAKAGDFLFHGVNASRFQATASPKKIILARCFPLSQG
jgi:hypothetical protein